MKANKVATDGLGTDDLIIINKPLKEDHMKRFINNYILLRHLHLQSRLMIYFSLLTIIPLFIVATVTYQSAERIIENNASIYTASKLQQSMNSVNLYFENADGLLQSIFFDRNLRQQIYNSKKSDFERTLAIAEVSRILKGYSYPNKYVGQIYIADLYDVFSSGPVVLNNLKKEEWFDEFWKSDDKFEIVPTHDASRYSFRLSNNIDTVITILRKYTNIEKNETLGIIGIDINYQYIYNVFENPEIDNGTTTLLITEQGEIVYSENQTLIGTTLERRLYEESFQSKSGSYRKTIDQVPYFIVYTTSEITNWKLIQLIPVNRLFEEAKKIKTNTLFVGFVCIILAMLLSVGASYSVSAPLKKLRRQMAKVEKGDMDVHMEISSSDEIAELSNSFNRMIKELSASIQKIYKDENIKKQIELNMLQQQINPHFLYNTLDSINWMARMQNSPNISSTITSLVKLLQASTYTNRDFITIGEEIDNIKNYIAIQKFRYGSMFEVVYDIDEAIIKKYTLKLILQTLVENAIYHGLEDKVEGGIIVIGGKIIENDICLWVEDNGKGIDQDKIDKILSKDIKESSRYSSIGISNTVKRIKLYYGEAYGLELKKLLDSGTKAVITIPIRSEERMKLDDQSDGRR